MNVAKLVGSLLLFAVSACSSAGSHLEVSSLCLRLREVKYMPVKPGETHRDEAYDALWRERGHVSKCLVELVSSNEPMRDPREEPTRNPKFTVGDLALFLILDFNGVDFDAFVPEEVWKSIRTQGVPAYFDWVQQPGNRELVAKKSREWLARSAH